MADPLTTVVESLRDTIRGIVREEIAAALEAGPAPIVGGKSKRNNPEAAVKNVQQTAEFLGVSRQTVLRMIAERSLPAICLRSGKRKKTWAIRKEVLLRWLQSKERQAQRAEVIPIAQGERSS